MRNKDIWKIAMEQSAIDLNCSVDDFMNKGNTVVISMYVLLAAPA